MLTVELLRLSLYEILRRVVERPDLAESRTHVPLVVRIVNDLLTALERYEIERAKGEKEGK